MLGARLDFESSCISFQTYNCYIIEAHKTRVEHQVCNDISTNFVSSSFLQLKFQFVPKTNFFFNP